jgi:hypothetical protein
MRRREIELEFAMAHRRWLADIGLSVLLALPMGALAQSAPVTHETSATSALSTTAMLQHAPPVARVSLLG